MITIDMDAAKAEVEAFRATWAKQKALLDETVAYAAKHKCDPGKDYWQAERAARRRYEMAREFYSTMLGG